MRRSVRFEVHLVHAATDATRAPLVYTLADGDELVFGRNPATANAPVPHFTVAKRHALARFTTEGPTIIDLFSHCGMYVNAQRVSSGQPFLLHDGDRIYLGQVQLVVRFDTPDAPAT
jgi:pSer/pThr/pTyr-binding forkhead associated (FHA) protein